MTIVILKAQHIITPFITPAALMLKYAVICHICVVFTGTSHSEHSVCFVIGRAFLRKGTKT